MAGWGENDKPLEDAPTLGAYSSKDKPASGALRRVGDAGISLARGIIGLPEAAVGVADLVTGGRAGKAAEDVGIRFKDAKDYLAEGYSPEQQAANANVADAKGFVPTLGAMARNPSTIASGVLESAPSMLLGGAVGRGAVKLIPKIGEIAAGAVGEGATAAGQNAEQVRQEEPSGTLSAKQSALLAASGALTGAIGLGAGRVANRLGLGDVETMLASGKLGPVGEQAVAAGANKSVLRKIAEGAAVEGGLQELPQSYQEQVAQNLAQGKPWDEGAGAQAAQGLLVGGAMGGAAAPLHAAEDHAPTPAPAPAGPITAALPALPAPVVRVDSEGNARKDGQPAPITDEGAANVVGRAAVDVPAAEAPLALPPPTVAVDSQGNARAPGQMAPAPEPGPRETGAIGLGRNSEPVIPAGPITAALGFDNSPSGTLIGGSDGVRIERRPEVVARLNEKRVQAGDILGEQDKPFQGAIPAARAARQAGPGYVVAKVEGGYVVRPTGDVTDVEAKTAPVKPSSASQKAVSDAQTTESVSPAPAPVTASPAPAAAVPAPSSAAPAPVAAGSRATSGAGTGANADAALKGAPHEQLGQGESQGAGGARAPAGQRGVDRAQPTAVSGEPPRAAGAQPAAGPAAPTTLSPVDAAAHTAATSPTNGLPEPTEAQKQAGNYPKGHTRIAGLDISIENPQGSTRSGTDESGKPWETTMRHHYGYVKGTTGNDGDHVDVFVKPGTPENFSGNVYVVDQVNPTTKAFDEHKSIIGAKSQAEAERIYRSNYSKGWKGMGAITAMPVEQFKEWVRDGKKDAPLAGTVKQPLSVGIAPGATEPVTVRDGVVHIGDKPAINFESGEDVKAPKGATDTDLKRALKEAGVLSRRQRFFGGTQEQPQQQQQASAGGRNARGAAYDRNPLRHFLATHGVSLDLAKEFAPGLKERRAAMVPGLGPIFRKSGLQLDQLAQRAVEEGYLPKDDPQALYGMIQRAMNGERIAPLYAEGAAEQEAQRRMEEQITKLKKPDFAGRTGFPDFALANNNAEIRRLRERLASAEQRTEAAASGPVQREYKGVRIEENAQDDRLRLFFDDKPSAEVRDDLKARGFRWSPSAGAWQRQLTDNARAAAQEILKKHFDTAPDEGEERPQMRRSQAQDGMGYTAVEQAVRELTRNWVRRPEIKILEGLDDPEVPDVVHAELQYQREQGSAGGTVHGFHLRGTVYLMADAVKSEADVATVLFHESLGHFGLRGFFGKSLNPILEEIVAQRKYQVVQKARAYGLDMAKGADRLMAAEEVLAELAQTRPELSIVQRAIAAIRTWLRAHVAAFKNLELSDAEIIRNFILPARGFVERGLNGKPTFTRDERAQAMKTERTVQVDGVRRPVVNSDGQQIIPNHDTEKLKNFWKWFGDSKVIDEQGRPLTVYHGTSASEPLTTFDGLESVGWFTEHAKHAEVYAGKDEGEDAAVYPVYLAIKNPLVLDIDMNDRADRARAALEEFNLEMPASASRAYEAINHWGFMEAARAEGYDGIKVKEDGHWTWAPLQPEQIKSSLGNNGDFSADDARVQFSKKAIVGETNRQYTPEQLKAMDQVGFRTDVPTLKERMQAVWKNAGTRLAQGIVDQFAPVKAIDKDAYGLLRLSKGASGAFETFMRGGKLKLTDKVYDFDDKQRGGAVDKLLVPLGGEHHDFFRWVAANRAERLMKEGRENLFTPESIEALKTLDQGVSAFDYTLQHDVHGNKAGTVTRDRTLIYRDAQMTLHEFNKNILDLAEQSGLIDGESRQLWEHEFYVPFYRVADEDSGGVRGMNIKSGVIRQEAFKELKGGKNALNADLLDNTLMNWAHLLDAAAKNRAAKATLDAAENLGLAIAAPEYTAQQIASAAASKKGLMWVMDGGVRRYYVLDQQSEQGPYLLTALTALEYAGMRSPVMNAMGAFKHALTVGVTASPFFKVRNLIRDSLQAIGTGPLSYNVGKNIKEGWQLTKHDADAYFRLMAGGGTIHFGTMLEGSEAKRIQALVESGVDDSTVLNSDQKLKAFYRRWVEPGITAYNELGNRGEAVNRAALYDQLVKQGVNHAEASLMARDLMDFSMQGAWTTVRFLTQVVPFFNARVQGLYKLGRAAKEDPARFATVLGTTALMSVALLAAYHDDDDWKKREDWDRNNFWWFKFGGMAFRIPKPFEMGAIATLAERGFELAFDKEMTNRRFMQQVQNLMADNLALNPIPQLIKPAIDVYANYDSFTQRPIEPQGTENLKKEFRFNDRSTMVARGASTALNQVAGLVNQDALSPMQIDHLLQGYFGWLGAFVIGASEAALRPATGQPTRAAPDYWKSLTGGMASDLEGSSSRYVTQMYQQAKEIEQAYGTWKLMQKQGKTEDAAQFRAENINLIEQHGKVERLKRLEGTISQRIRILEASEAPAGQKRDEIRALQRQKDRIARNLAPL